MRILVDAHPDPVQGEIALGASRLFRRLQILFNAKLSPEFLLLLGHKKTKSLFADRVAFDHDDRAEDRVLGRKRRMLQDLSLSLAGGGGKPKVAAAVNLRTYIEAIERDQRIFGDRQPAVPSEEVKLPRVEVLGPGEGSIWQSFEALVNDGGDHA